MTQQQMDLLPEMDLENQWEPRDIWELLAELREAILDAPHDGWCAINFPDAPIDMLVCNCWKSRIS
jgi:hypothetical protein